MNIKKTIQILNKKPKTKAMKKLGILMIVVLLLGSNCSKKEEKLEVSDVCTFILVNDSDIDTHMWITGEDIMPGNKLAPGGERQVTYLKSEAIRTSTYMDDPQPVDIVQVYCGRNGKIVAWRECEISSYDLQVKTWYLGGNQMR